MNFDFCVIGGGIAGLSIAAELSAHASVLVLEKESELAYHTTGRSASLYSELVAGGPALALSKLSRAFLVDPPTGFTSQPLHRYLDCLFTATRSEEVLLDQTMATHPGLLRLSAEQILDLIPWLRTGEGYITAGLLEKDAFKIDVAGLFDAYRRQFLSRGGAIRCNAEVSRMSPGPSGWTVFLGENENVSTTIVVNAAGAWGDLVAGMAGVEPLGLTPKRRTMIVFDLPENEDLGNCPCVGGIEDDYYFLPEGTQLIGSSADETPSLPVDAQAEEYDIALAAHNIESNITFPIKRIQNKWAGLRTFAPDLQLVAGYDISHSNFFWFVGQGGTGIQSAPAAAIAAATLALRKPLPLKYETLGVTAKALSPERFHG